MFFFLFGAVRFHTALFSSEPEIVNKTTRVLRSSIHWTEILKQEKQEVRKQANHGDFSECNCNYFTDFLLSATNAICRHL